MRRYDVALATLVASLAFACGQGSAPAVRSPATGASSTIGMFLSRASSFSSKDSDDLAKGCAADVKKSCATVRAADVRTLARCLNDHRHDLSDGCRAAIKKMRHDKHGDDACAGACACGQTCVGDDEEKDHDDKDKGKDGGSSGDSGKGKSSLRGLIPATTSHDATHDDDHDDDDLSCAGPCPAGMSSCDGRCVDLKSDPENCGKCEDECDEHGRTAVCSAGKCAAKCAAPLKSCEDACVSTSTDPLNCGGCGIACGCDQTCSNGVCVGGGCPAGQHSCNNTCVADTDPNACGASCTVCPTDPNGIAVCTAGVCGLVCIPPALLVNGVCNIAALHIGPGAR